ncbi:hypothetical protein [Mesorhizobium zhangyense]|uniref:hypothetical protein n=1 Tax=Mesorhizobium zhangyense TaxID=1776730 RepID=UPI0035E449C6
MDDAACRQILMGRNRRPCWKGAGVQVVGSAGEAQNTGGIEAVAEDIGVTFRSVGRVFGAETQHRIVEAEARLLADIKRRMRVEYLQPGQQQEEKRERPYPMRQPRPGGLPIDEPVVLRRLDAGLHLAGCRIVHVLILPTAR